MTQCPECGFMHPPVAPGTCLVANERKAEIELSQEYNVQISQGILDTKNDLMKMLDRYKKVSNPETFNRCIAYIKKVRNFINNTPI
jgi:hypothetical protein